MYFRALQMAVEKMQGISRLEQFVEELSEEERAKELKQEKKRQKKKNRRKNKCGFDISEQESEDKDKDLDEVKLLTKSQTQSNPSILLYIVYMGSTVHYMYCRATCWTACNSFHSFGVLQGSIEAVKDSCKVCGSHGEEEETARCEEGITASGSTSCNCSVDTKQSKNAHRIFDLIMQ